MLEIMLERELLDSNLVWLLIGEDSFFFRLMSFLTERGLGFGC